MEYKIAGETKIASDCIAVMTYLYIYADAEQRALLVNNRERGNHQMHGRTLHLSGAADQRSKDVPNNQIRSNITV
jgi:hypothetical protein